MTEEEIRALAEIRAEQSALRERWRQIELRILALEKTGPAPALAQAPPAPPPLPMAAPAGLPRPAGESLEMRIGGDWFVRVGVVLLLTSLAFLGHYLYQHVVPRLGPAGKVSLLYLGAGALAGFGAWLERSRQARERPGLQNYARVVLAGGLAAVYYVTYAAHYYPNLQVISSPLAAGVLLIAWTAFMVWLADRRNSEMLATAAILLAFYTSAINETAGFTLYANLALAAGAAVLLRRHLWSFLPIASVLATYGGYGFWRDFHSLLSASPATGGFATDAVFLGVYWLLFTGTVFFPGKGVPGNARAALAGLNNGAYFALAGWALLTDDPASYWKWPVACGVVLLMLAVAARRVRPRLDAATEGVFLTEGVLLVTLGGICYFSGWQLSLALVVQSTALVAAAGRRRNLFLWGLACLSAALALGYTVQSYSSAFPGSALAGGGALLLFNAWRCARVAPAGAAPDDEADQFDWVSKNPEASWFCLLGEAAWLAWIEQWGASAGWRSVEIIAAALALTAASELLALPVVALLALFYVLLAHAHQLSAASACSAWCALLLFAGTAALGQWRRRRSKELWIPGLCASLAAFTGWGVLSAHAQHWNAPAFGLTGAWSLYAAAIFGLGLALRERAYRLLGLIILAFALVHIAVWDIWQLDSLGRAISALSLGGVLLAVGFLYNRYRSTLRDIF